METLKEKTLEAERKAKEAFINAKKAVDECFVLIHKIRNSQERMKKVNTLFNLK